MNNVDGNNDDDSSNFDEDDAQFLPRLNSNVVINDDGTINILENYVQNLEDNLNDKSIEFGEDIFSESGDSIESGDDSFDNGVDKAIEDDRIFDDVENTHENVNVEDIEDVFMANEDEIRTRTEIDKEIAMYDNLLAKETNSKEKRILMKEKRDAIDQLQGRLNSCKTTPIVTSATNPTIRIEHTKPKKPPIWISGQDFEKWIDEIEDWELKDTRDDAGKCNALM